MIHLEHQRQPGHLAAWRALGHRQTLGPTLSKSRRLWLQTGRKVWVATTNAMRAEKADHRLFAVFLTASKLWR
jgi:hypothetical protein